MKILYLVYYWHQVIVYSFSGQCVLFKPLSAHSTNFNGCYFLSRIKTNLYSKDHIRYSLNCWPCHCCVRTHTRCQHSYKKKETCFLLCWSTATCQYDQHEHKTTLIWLRNNTQANPNQHLDSSKFTICNIKRIFYLTGDKWFFKCIFNMRKKIKCFKSVESTHLFQPPTQSICLLQWLIVNNLFAFIKNLCSVRDCFFNFCPLKPTYSKILFLNRFAFCHSLNLFN